MRRSKHGIDSMVISLGGIAPQGPLSHNGNSFLLSMMRHDIDVQAASMIPCQILLVRCINYLATSFVASCQIPCHFQAPLQQKLLTQDLPLLVEKLELNNDVGEACHLA